MHPISRDVRAVSDVRDSAMAVPPAGPRSLWLRWRVGCDVWRGWEDGVGMRMMEGLRWKCVYVFVSL